MKINLVPKILLFWYFFIFFSTEILSYFHQITSLNIQLLETIFLGGMVFSYRRELNKLLLKFNFSKTNLIILLILTLTFIQGFFSAPSTTDSMVYHLPKVMYWVQERTLEQDIIRNIHDFKGPFAEYIVLHLYLLVGSDRLAFLSQWLAFSVSIYLTGVIAAQLGADKKQISYIRLFSATLGMAVMQSVSTQVDLVVTVLVLIAFHICLLFSEKANIINAVMLGIAIGLGILTKAAYVIYLIIPLGMLFLIFLKKPQKKFIYLLGISLVLCLLIQIRFITQNQLLYGSFLGNHILWDGTELKYTNEVISTQGIISNTIKNLLIHIPVPIFSSYVQGLIVNLHYYLGVDVNDPSFTCCGTKFKVLSMFYPQEDIVSNPIHLLLIFIAFFYLVRVKDFQKRYFFLLSILTFVMFSAVLKWQPYHSRLEIPIFLTSTIASILILRKKEGIIRALLFISVVLAFLVLFFNVSRPFISYGFFYKYVSQFSMSYTQVPESFFVKPREEQYFNAEHLWYFPYKNIVDKIASLNRDISISFDLGDDFEYPLWVLLKNKKVRFNVIPKKKIGEAQFLIITPDKSRIILGYNLISCERADNLDNAYACLYNLRN